MGSFFTRHTGMNYVGANACDCVLDSVHRWKTNFTNCLQLRQTRLVYAIEKRMYTNSSIIIVIFAVPGVFQKSPKQMNNFAINRKGAHHHQ